MGIGLNPVFHAMADGHPRCLERLCCDAIQQLWIVPDNLVFAFNDLSTCMYFVAGGKVTYYKYDDALRTLASYLGMTTSAENSRETMLFMNKNKVNKQTVCSDG